MRFRQVSRGGTLGVSTVELSAASGWKDVKQSDPSEQRGGAARNAWTVPIVMSEDRMHRRSRQLTGREHAGDPRTPFHTLYARL